MSTNPGSNNLRQPTRQPQRHPIGAASAATSRHRPPLQGLELIAGEYQRLPERELADGTLALASAVLGLELRLAARGLRFHDPATGQDLPNLAETDQARQREKQARQETETRLAREGAARQEAETRLAREGAARHAAEARVAELEALLQQARGGSGQSG